MNFVNFLELSAKDSLDKTAIIEEGEKITYRELWQRVDILAKAFLDIGIKEGDRIAIALPNCREYIYAFFAALKIKAIAVPLTQKMTSYELKTILKDCQPVLFITDNIFLRRVLPFDPVIGIGKLIICSRRIMGKATFKKALKIDDLFRTTFRLGTTFPADDETVASINYTYRGYGYPLGAMLTHGNYRAGAKGYISTVRIREQQQSLLILPVGHIYAFMSCIVVSFLAKAIIVIPHDLSPKTIFQEIDKGINIINLVPVVYLNLLKNWEKYKGGRDTICCSVSGGSPMPLEMYFAVKEKFNWEIRQGYGLTECMPIVINPHLGNKPESMGKAGFSVKVNVVGEKDEKKKLNEVGEIVIGGPTVMKGYYNKPRETGEILKAGWCYSGDYGYFDIEDYLYFAGLKKKIAKVGGNMVDLKEVENNIYLFPDVINTKVDTVKDNLWGRVLTAEVIVKNPKKFNTVKLKSFLRSRLSAYKIPRLKIVR